MDFNDGSGDVERDLAKARKALQAFEDGVDSARVRLRLQTASPSHPVLLAKSLFLLLTILFFFTGVATLGIPFAAPDLARQFAAYERGLGVPIPAVLLVLAVCLLIAWFMADQAAVAIGRESPMLPWEKKEHQRLVNDVTRLSSQKAVQERIRGTPMGARPRISTPVPVSLRQSTPGGAQPRYASHPGASPRFGTPTGTGGGGLFGSRPSAPSYASGNDAAPSYSTPAPSRRPSTSTTGITSGGGGGITGSSSGLSVPKPSLGPSTSAPRGTPLGAAPRAGRALGTPAPASQRKPRLAAPMAYPGTPEPAAQRSSNPNVGGGSIFGTPAPASRSQRETPAPASSGSYGSPEPTPEPMPDIVDASSYSGGYSAPGYTGASAQPAYAASSQDGMPKWGRIDEPWLEDAIEKAEIMASTFPVQAHLEFSTEEHLPFTLVIERATPAMAVRAMVSYVEFLASIATPARGRIELRSVAHIDRSFHRNVMAALEPYFTDSVEVERHDGRVDIIFHEPDAGWGNHPYLPIAG